MIKIKELLSKYRKQFIVLVLTILLVFSASKLYTSGMIFNLIPSKADNYVLIIPETRKVAEGYEYKPTSVNIYYSYTNMKVKANVEYLKEYGQYVVLLKKGSYQVVVNYYNGPQK